MTTAEKSKLMYDPSFEKMLVGWDLSRKKMAKQGHQLVDYALTMLERMNHRGGTGAEPDTGDGAGILMPCLIVSSRKMRKK